jgi:hypothetical protein
MRSGQDALNCEAALPGHTAGESGIRLCETQYAACPCRNSADGCRSASRGEKILRRSTLLSVTRGHQCIYCVSSALQRYVRRHDRADQRLARRTPIGSAPPAETGDVAENILLALGTISKSQGKIIAAWSAPASLRSPLILPVRLWSPGFALAYRRSPRPSSCSEAQMRLTR